MQTTCARVKINMIYLIVEWLCKETHQVESCVRDEDAKGASSLPCFPGGEKYPIPTSAMSSTTHFTNSEIEG